MAAETQQTGSTLAGSAGSTKPLASPLPALADRMCSALVAARFGTSAMWGSLMRTMGFSFMRGSRVLGSLRPQPQLLPVIAILRS